jgi:phosphoadenosine phosphosulfate reductase
MNLTELNKKYLSLSPQQRINELYADFSQVLLTSSFGTTAVYLIHQFQKANPKQEIVFLDTTYHFPETLEYKNYLRQKFNLNITELKGDEWRNKFTAQDKTWAKDADLCCSINKVEPLEQIKPNYQVWVSGLMKSQNEHRAQLNIFEERNGIIKFYPIIDINEQEVNSYIKENNLPEHPLKAQGYNSIGCTHCTGKGQSREGRWINKSKTECGLHS